MAGGSQPLPFGHSREAAVDIEGLVVCGIDSPHVFGVAYHGEQLLEDHYKQMREEEGIESGDEHEEDDDAAWDNWEVESDSSESSEGWISVSSDSDDDIEISDSEDEKDAEKGKKKAKPKQDDENDEATDGMKAGGEAEVGRVSSLATTKVSWSTIFASCPH